MIMQLLKMNKPQCLLYSAAMLLNEDPQVLIKEIGHDGMEVWWPQFSDDRQYRSHSMQEIIDCFWRRACWLMPIDGYPMQTPGNGAQPEVTYPDHAARFCKYIRGNPALLIGRTKGGGGHAWAWDGAVAYDPRGLKSSIHDLSIQTSWLMGMQQK